MGAESRAAATSMEISGIAFSPCRCDGSGAALRGRHGLCTETHRDQQPYSADHFEGFPASLAFVSIQALLDVVHNKTSSDAVSFLLATPGWEPPLFLLLIGCRTHLATLGKLEDGSMRIQVQDQVPKTKVVSSQIHLFIEPKIHNVFPVASWSWAPSARKAASIRCVLRPEIYESASFYVAR